MDILQKLSEELDIKYDNVVKTVELLDEGNTIPFIARYRKEITGNLTDETLRQINDRLTYLRNLQERKDDITRLIDEQGKLTEDLKKQIEVYSDKVVAKSNVNDAVDYAIEHFKDDVIIIFGTLYSAEQAYEHL